MGVQIKFCGLTRPGDASQAAELGATYVGVIFAESPRRVSPAQAAKVLAAAGPALRRVGVFGAADVATIAHCADEAALDVIQLHADPTPDDVREVRDATGREVWAAIRIASSLVELRLSELAQVADAVLLDSFRADRLGGSGVTLEWPQLADSLARVRAGGVGGEGGGARLVLAGGLTPDNVRSAISVLAPDVVDVSSGVEESPGVKDHARMRAFATAVKYELDSNA